MSFSTAGTFNPVLSEALNKIPQNRFVGLQILPPRLVDTRKGTYPVVEGNQVDNDSSKKTAPGSKTPRIDFQYGSDTYVCENYKLGGDLPIEDQNQAADDGFLDAQGALMQVVQRDLMVGHERRVSSLLYPSSSPFNSTNGTAAMSSSSTAKPIKDIQNAVDRLNANGIFENLFVIMESSLFNEMLNTDDVRGIFNGNSEYVNRQVLLDAFGVNGLIVCPTRYNSAAKGKAVSRTKVWPEDKYLVGQVVGGNFMQGGFGRTLAYQPNGGIFTADEFTDDDGEVLTTRVKNCVDEVIINSNAAELIASV